MTVRGVNDAYSFKFVATITWVPIRAGVESDGTLSTRKVGRVGKGRSDPIRRTRFEDRWLSAGALRRSVRGETVQW